MGPAQEMREIIIERNVVVVDGDDDIGAAPHGGEDGERAAGNGMGADEPVTFPVGMLGCAKRQISAAERGAKRLRIGRGVAVTSNVDRS